MHGCNSHTQLCIAGIMNSSITRKVWAKDHSAKKSVTVTYFAAFKEEGEAITMLYFLLDIHEHHGPKLSAIFMGQFLIFYLKKLSQDCCERNAI